MGELGHNQRWEQIREIGSGGQGRVYVVRDKRGIGSSEILTRLQRSIPTISSKAARRTNDNSQRDAAEELLDTLRHIVRTESPKNQAALKVLHSPTEARDALRSDERIRREITAMSKANHPHLLRILDCDADEGWFVSEYHRRGTLGQNLNYYKGDFPAALRAIRPLVEGVAELHEKGMVHRDIKPQNVFVSDANELILGDFGLVFFDDDERTRLSATLESVGTRHWMPAWAYTKRVEEITPAFDVFSLGKLLWAMVSGRPVLNLWYFDRPENNLAGMFPDSPSSGLANQLLEKCVVENEEECLASAVELLREVDIVLRAVEANCQVVGDSVPRSCRVCGRGKYSSVANRNLAAIRNFGLRVTGIASFKIFACDHCGHVDLFYFKDEKSNPVWSETQ